jgi:hypothetical protein
MSTLLEETKLAPDLAPVKPYSISTPGHNRATERERGYGLWWSEHGGALRRIFRAATTDKAHGRAAAARSPLPGVDVHIEDEGSSGYDQDSRLPADHDAERAVAAWSPLHF